jgi:hypothetical protein
VLATTREVRLVLGFGPATLLGWRLYWRAGKRLPRSSADGCGCDGRARRTARNISTYAVPPAPSPHPERIEQSGDANDATPTPRRRAAKKTRNDVKKMRQRRRLKEDGRTKSGSFTPTKLMHF